MKCKTILMVVSMAAFGFLQGCDNRGPAEKAGERFDDGIEKIQDKTEEAGEKVEDAAEDVQDRITE